jgi:hypothetical protein
MTGPLLRTGSLRAFQPLGAVGNPVYLAAAQLRAAMGRRLGAEVVDTFAIPQRNEDGDTIDWYAPAPGPVVPWSAATPEEQARAKERLLAVRERIEELGGAMEAEAGPERQVFGRLLAHVTSFPGDDHVYLVNDRPVVTFWGFLENDAPVGSDPLLTLPVTEEAPAPARRRVPWWVWLLLLLLLLGLLYLLWSALKEPPPEPSPPAAAPPALTQPPAWSPETGTQSPPDPPGGPSAPPEPPVAEPPPAAMGETPAPDQVRIREGRTWVGTERAVTAVERLETGVSTEVPVGDGVVLEPVAVGQDTTLLDTAERVESEAAGVIEETTGVVGQTDVPGEGPGEASVEPGEVAPEAGIGAGEAPAEIPQDETPIDLQPPPGERVSSEAAGETAEPSRPGEESAKGAEPALPSPGDLPQGETAVEPIQPPEEAVAAPLGAPPVGGASEAPTSGPGQDPAAAGTESARPLPGRAQETAAGTTRGRTVRLLDSGWRTRTTLQDPRTGLPVKLDYRLKDGAGRVELKRADGSVCGGDVKAAVVGGNLVIDSLGNIVCPDGTNFGRPTLECKPGPDGRADCRGRYPSGESFSVDITREPK